MQHRVISQNEVERQQDGSVRIAVGIWIDKEGNAHISVPELLEMVDLPNTVANRKIVTDMAVRMLQGVRPECDIVMQEVKRD